MMLLYSPLGWVLLALAAILKSSELAPVDVLLFKSIRVVGLVEEYNDKPL